MGYASRTGTKRNLAALRDHGWRLFVSAEGEHRTEGFAYAIDNGAWTAFTMGKQWDAGKFRALVDLHGRGADFIVLPDIVSGGMESFERSAEWIHRLEGIAPLVFPVQPDQPEAMIVEMIEQCGVGIFVGGDSEWKEQTMPVWGRMADELGCYLHVGRVNSRRRIKLCALAGADSFDGTSITRYAVNIHTLDAARRQQTIWSKGEV